MLEANMMREARVMSEANEIREAGVMSEANEMRRGLTSKPKARVIFARQVASISFPRVKIQFR